MLLFRQIFFGAKTRREIHVSLVRLIFAHPRETRSSRLGREAGDINIRRHVTRVLLVPWQSRGVDQKWAATFELRRARLLSGLVP